MEKTCDKSPAKKPRRCRKRQKKTAREAEHKPYAVAYKLNSHIPAFNRPVQSIYGDDCMEQFLSKVDEINSEITESLKKIAPPIMPDVEMLGKMKSELNCCICEEAMVPGEKKDLDHDHISGEVFGYAHPSKYDDVIMYKHCSIDNGDSNRGI